MATKIEEKRKNALHHFLKVAAKEKADDVVTLDLVRLLPQLSSAPPDLNAAYISYIKKASSLGMIANLRSLAVLAFNHTQRKYNRPEIYYDPRHEM